MTPDTMKAIPDGCVHTETCVSGDQTVATTYESPSGVEYTETWVGYTTTYKAPTVEILMELMAAVKNHSDRKNENK